MNHQLYIYPTDTVWGIGGSIYSFKAYEEVLRIKGIVGRKPLNILFSSLEDLKLNINFPEQFNDDWLKTFFSLGTSLLVPINWAQSEFPKIVLGDSNESISIRLLTYPHIKKICKECNGAITSTSLNLTGTSPILSKIDAFNFLNHHDLKNVKICDVDLNLSGKSSTMVKVVKEKLEIFREGARLKEVLEHVRLLSA